MNDILDDCEIEHENECEGESSLPSAKKSSGGWENHVSEIDRFCTARVTTKRFSSAKMMDRP